MTGNVFKYGVAINFFGNYTREGDKAHRQLENINKEMHNLQHTSERAFTKGSASMFGFSKQVGNLATKFDTATASAGRLLNKMISLRKIMIAGTIVYAIKRITGAFYEMGKEMEINFARMKTVLGSVKEVKETLLWAREKGVLTPYTISEVNRAVTMMTTFGFNKNKEMREKAFTAIGDFAGARGMDFDEAVSMVAKAGFGNPRQLMMRTGIHPSTLDDVVSRSVKSPELKKEMREQVEILKSAVKGTQAYKLAWVELLGLLHKGGMADRMNTVSGALSNVSDIFENFFIDLIGYSQESGTLFSAIADTIKTDLLGAFDQVIRYELEHGDQLEVSAQHLAQFTENERSRYAMLEEKMANMQMLSQQELLLYEKVHNAQLKVVTINTEFRRLGESIGDMFRILWVNVDKAVGGITQRFIDFIQKAKEWMANFRGNVAPLIVYLTLWKYKIKDIFGGLWEGFSKGFGGVMTVLETFKDVLFDILGKFGISERQAIDALTVSFGALFGVLAGVKVARLLMIPQALGGIGKVVTTIAGKSVLGKAAGGMMQRGTVPTMPMYVAVVNSTGGGGYVGGVPGGKGSVGGGKWGKWGKIGRGAGAIFSGLMGAAMTYFLLDYGLRALGVDDDVVDWAAPGGAVLSSKFGRKATLWAGKKLINPVRSGKELWGAGRSGVNMAGRGFNAAGRGISSGWNWLRAPFTETRPVYGGSHVPRQMTKFERILANTTKTVGRTNKALSVASKGLSPVGRWAGPVGLGLSGVLDVVDRWDILSSGKILDYYVGYNKDAAKLLWEGAKGLGGLVGIGEGGSWKNAWDITKSFGKNVFLTLGNTPVLAGGLDLVQDAFEFFGADDQIRADELARLESQSLQQQFQRYAYRAGKETYEKGFRVLSPENMTGAEHVELYYGKFKDEFGTKAVETAIDEYARAYEEVGKGLRETASARIPRQQQNQLKKGTLKTDFSWFDSPLGDIGNLIPQALIEKRIMFNRFVDEGGLAMFRKISRGFENMGISNMLSSVPNLVTSGLSSLPSISDITGSISGFIGENQDLVNYLGQQYGQIKAESDEEDAGVKEQTILNFSNINIYANGVKQGEEAAKAFTESLKDSWWEI